MIKPTLLLLSLLAACGHGRHETQDTKQPIDLVLEKRDLYASQHDRIAGPTGFFIDTNCDSLLFNALYHAGTDFRDITAFQGEPGRWYRTPDHKCYDEKRSGSDVSRDMLIGVMWWAFVHGQSEVLAQLLDYGKAHDWIMGRGSKDRTYFTPNLQKTLYALLGKDYKGLPEAWVDPIKDHQRHVVALNIILRGERRGHINNDMLKLLEKFYAENPNNGLFAYGVARFTDGNQAETINILLNPRWFPSDRLPRSADRCGLWLWERSDKHANWQSCDENEVHSGGELIFIAHLLERSQGKSLAIRDT